MWDVAGEGFEVFGEAELALGVRFLVKQSVDYTQSPVRFSPLRGDCNRDLLTGQRPREIVATGVKGGHTLERFAVMHI